MSEMIERVAKALCQSDERNGGAPWDWYNDKGQERYREAAREAIEAMREPTEAMVRAIDDAPEAPTWTECRVAEYRAMIDAALASGAPETSSQ